MYHIINIYNHICIYINISIIIYVYTYIYYIYISNKKYRQYALPLIANLLMASW